MFKGSAVLGIAVLIFFLGPLISQGGGANIALGVSVAFCMGMILLVVGSRSGIRPGRTLATAGEGVEDAGRDDELSEEERRFLINIFFAGLLLRIGLSILITIFDPGRYFDGDAVTYEQVGRTLAKYWHGHYAFPQKLERAILPSYYHLNALIFYIFGYSRLIPQLINCVIGSLLILMFHSLCRQCFGSRAARVGAVIAAFYPSMIMWSIINVRDIWSLFALTGVVLQGINLKRNIRPGSVLWLLFYLVLLFLLRKYLVSIVLVSFFIGFTISGGKKLLRNYLILAVVTIMLAYFLNRAGSDLLGFEQINLENIDFMRQKFAAIHGRTRYLPNADISTPQGALAYLPLGITYFLLAPFPWAIDFGVLRQVAALPEVLIWYFMVPYVIMGIRTCLKENSEDSNFILAFVIGMLIPYSLVEANAGTAFRHRIQIILFLLIFASVTISRRLERRGREAGGPAAT
ncbi:glycosyltransferase family 39 protein [Thermodesulfobacteriota bacterium]